jgi:enoyl-CoA hydratase/carnithine racemase
MIRSRRLGDDLVLIELSRPEKLNALTRDLIEQLQRELVAAGSDETARGVVIAGAGGNFCAGVDLREFAEGTQESGRALITALRDLCATVRQLPKPVASAIQGHCLGGALELAACCDFRICSPDARLGMPEVFLGIPSVIDAAMLQRHVGVGRARELLLTGESIGGETAYQWGLVNRVAPPGQVIDVAADLVRLAGRHHPEVVAVQKRLHEEWLSLPYECAVESSVDALVDAFRSGRPQQLGTARLRKK